MCEKALADFMQEKGEQFFYSRDDDEPEPESHPATAPSLVLSQVVVKRGHGHNTAAGATKARR